MALFTSDIVLDLAGIAVALIVCVVAYIKWAHGYWTRHGLYQVEPSIPFGNAGKLFTKKQTMGEMFMDVYNNIRSKGLKHGGCYFFAEKTYVPVDLDIVKHILQVDFQHFVNHGNHVDEENDPLTGNLFALEDDKWRKLRVKLTPTFTSGKMKMMFHTMVDCTKGLSKIFEEAFNKSSALDIKDVMGRFTTDIIGSCAFGLDINSMENPESEFRKFGLQIFGRSFLKSLRIFLPKVFPRSFLKLVKYNFFDRDVAEFFSKSVKDTVEYRETNNIYRKDFMHLLLQLKNLGKVTDDGKILQNGEKQEVSLTMNELTAQVFVFFVAGFETSSTLMTFTLYELASRPDIQKKMQQEIDSVLSKHNNELTYEGIIEMTYMSKVVNEALRMYPPVPIIRRICTKSYKVPGTDIIIEKGTQVVISVLGIHRDSKIYPEPEVFNPENFSDETKNKRHNYSFLPFGEGPRICIGLRFGLLQAKVGLACLLREYNVTMNEKTKIPVQFSPENLILSPQETILLNITKRDF